MGSIQYVPRWLHKQVTLEGGDPPVRIPSTEFRNDEVWNWHLKWISLTGVVDVDASAGDYDFDSTYGGVARRLKWNIGQSQKGDISLAVSTTDAILGCNHRQRQCYSYFDPSYRFDFPVPFRLPPDTGINAEVRLDLPSPDQTAVVYYPGIVLNGYYKRMDGQRRPGQLAGHSEKRLYDGTSTIFEGADLWNDGDSDFMITEMLVQPHQYEADGTLWSQGSVLRWRVNPSTGTPWMPRAELIPAGNIAPYNRSFLDTYDQSPRVYTFPQETILKPRQHVGIQAENIASDDQIVDLCVFGVLEVR